MEGGRVKGSAQGGARFWHRGRCQKDPSTVHPKGFGWLVGAALYTLKELGWLVSASEGFRTWMCEVPTPREVWRKDGRTGDGGTEQVGVRSTGHRGMKEEK